MILLGWFVISVCARLSLSILNRGSLCLITNWIADTISDLGAGRFEFIVDIGLYTYRGGGCQPLTCGTCAYGRRGGAIGILPLRLVLLA